MNEEERPSTAEGLRAILKLIREEYAYYVSILKNWEAIDPDDVLDQNYVEAQMLLWQARVDVYEKAIADLEAVGQG